MSKINSGYEIYAIISIILIVITFLLTSLEYFSAMLGPKAGHIYKILVAIGILVGIAFGVIALVHALTDPCMRQPGTHWDPDTKRCIVPEDKKTCNKICTLQGQKGLCLDHYCDYSSHEFGYAYTIDEENCACTMDCVDGGDTINPNHPELDYTKMTLKDPADVKSGYIPINELICGSKCRFDNAGYCVNEEECKISIDKRGKVLRAGSERGCFTPQLMPQYEQCSDPEVMCDKSTMLKCLNSASGINVPASVEYGYPAYGTFTSYCSTSNLCDEASDEVICSSNADCKLSDGTSGNCNIGIEQTDKEHPFRKKGYLYLGTCDNSSLHEYDPGKCHDPKYIGEMLVSGEESLAEIMYTIAAGDLATKEGISLNQPQCITDNTAVCLSSNLEPQIPWFCNSKDGCNFIVNDSTLESCPKDAPSTKAKAAFKPTCCGSHSLSKMGAGHFCCPGKVQQGSTGKSIYGLCTNNSEYQPDATWLSMSEAEIPVNCTSDEECEGLDSIVKTKLMSKLGLSDSNTEPNYGKLYCDTSQPKGQCKFNAGYRYQISGGELSGMNEYIIGNDESLKESTAIKSGLPNYSTVPGQFTPHAGEENILFCNTSSDNTPKFGNYNVQGTPVPFAKATATDYTNIYTQDLTQTKKSTYNITDLDCLNIARHKGGFVKTNLKDYTSKYSCTSDGEHCNSYNTGKVSNTPSPATPSGFSVHQCAFTVDCPQADTMVTLSDGEQVPQRWQPQPDSDGENFQKLNPQGIKGMTFAAKLKGYPAMHCGNFSSKEQCEDSSNLDLPTAWKDDYSSLFVNPCVWEGNIGSMYCAPRTADSSPPKYSLYGNHQGEYSEKGFCYNSDDGKISPCT